MDLAELLIREQVRETFTRYTTAGDGGRLADLVAQFTEDATMEVPPRAPATGREAIFAMLSDSAMHTRPPVAFEGQTPILRHFTTNIHFRSVTAERVETTAYFCAMTAVGPDHWGRYFDVLVPAEGRWLFARRLAKAEGWAPGGWYDGNRRRDLALAASDGSDGHG
jgi:hypothetical protein